MTVSSSNGTYKAFAKVISVTSRPTCDSIYGTLTPTIIAEYSNLVHLNNTIHDKSDLFPRPIGLLHAPDYSLMLAEYMERYSSLSAVMLSFVLPRPQRTQEIVKVGISVLDKFGQLQKALFNPEYSSPDLECKLMLGKLSHSYSLSSQARSELASVIEQASARGSIRIRKGIIHGDLGPRNILIGQSGVVFLDWEAMQSNCMPLYDCCYFVITLVMRCVQLGIPPSQLNYISSALFRHVADLETQLDSCNKTDLFTRKDIWLGKCMALLQVLSAYERDAEGGGYYPLLRQRGRQIQYLQDVLGREMLDDGTIQSETG